MIKLFSVKARLLRRVWPPHAPPARRGARPHAARRAANGP
jgi:hypothetical protein